jgi:GTP cyclohydrolase II
VTVSQLEGHQGRCIAFQKGLPIEPTLIRLQSRCTYGEVFGSTHCDCRDQLEAAWDRICFEDNGIVVYLDQDGRGSGAVAKARAYRDEAMDGIDTFTSYARQGLRNDERSYVEAAELLNKLGISKIRLMTNNPDKVASLMAVGFQVDRVPLIVPPKSEQAARYLSAKLAKGHLL